MKNEKTKEKGTKRKNRKRAPLGLGRWLIILVCGIVFCGSLGYLGLYVQDKMSSQKDFATLATAKDSGLEKLYAKNNDFVGWLKINGTKVDYPVMHTPSDPEYYIHRDFEKNYSESGTPFLDGLSVMSEPNKTWNWFIYGHNMKFGTMFHDLLKYESKGFWKEHKTFTFETYLPEQNGGNAQATDKQSANAGSDSTYKIFAACYSQIRSKDSTKFKYYQYPACTDEETFNEFVKGVKDEAVYDTGLTPKFGDQLVTLSTCAYQTNEGRFYIVGYKTDKNQ